jgi:hypothetical protein
VPPDDPTALATAIDALWHDDTRRAVMAQAATQWALTQFGAQQMVTASLAIYRQTVEASLYGAMS